jgi:predicted aldo/keto reductase-like oxidoreductase
VKKVRLGRTNMMVSKLGFGGIPIQRVSEDEAVAVVRRCLELGITFIDTANAYTNSEERIGKAILGWPEKPILATKTTARTGEGVGNHLKLSLKRLGVESIDLYQFHDVSDFNTLKTILDANGPMAAVIEAKRAGLVKHIGVSSHTMDVAKELVKSDRFETIMFPLNFITSEAADELLLLTREHDVGFIAMKPLEGGMLDNVTIAFKYLFQFPDVVSIVGIEKVREIEEIVQIVAGPQTITTGEEKEMERLRQELGKRFCRRCNYCQPCPEEIPISLVLEFPSIVRRLPPEGILSGFIAEAMEKAANCTKCGECEERCPYNLPIQEMIEEHVRWYQIEKKRYQGQATSK